MVALILAKKLFSNCCTLRFVLFSIMDKFVMRTIRDSHPGLNPASSEATNTPFT